MEKISGHIADLTNGIFYDGILTIEDDRIRDIRRSDDPDEAPEQIDDVYILPGFIDAHLHIESTMLTPREFAKEAVRHGSVAALCDPHEIANVCGERGIDFMTESAAGTPFRFYFGAPSCVPATGFETSGARFTSEHIRRLLARDDIHFLAEMMNFPGVVQGDRTVLDILSVASASGKPIDGHAPGLLGEELAKYAAKGISTDHECRTLEEALAKIAAGIKIQIREGSAARDFESLAPLLQSHPDRVMFCSDDKHPDDLLEGHIDALVRRAVAKGYPVMNVLRAASLNPVEHYGLDTGLLRKGDPADFILVDNLNDFTILATYIGGRCVYRDGVTIASEWHDRNPAPCNDTFIHNPVTIHDLQITSPDGNVDVMVAADKQLYTGWDQELTEADVPLVSDTKIDRLKIVVCNRYTQAPPAIAFIRGFGLKRGALASSVAHDSHNIIAVGCCDTDLAASINAVIAAGGGIATADSGAIQILKLPVAGLMSDAPAADVARRYAELNEQAISMGCTMQAPFMTLSFMALPVIPRLKLTDKGLFDVEKFRFCNEQK